MKPPIRPKKLQPDQSWPKSLKKVARQRKVHVASTLAPDLFVKVHGPKDKQLKEPLGKRPKKAVPPLKITAKDRLMVAGYWTERGICLPDEIDGYVATGRLKGGKQSADRLALWFARYRILLKLESLQGL